jgi:tyrosinase
MTEIDQLQARANRLLGAAGSAQASALAVAEQATAPFSPFVPEQLDRALDLTERLMAAAERADGEAGLEVALEEAERLREEQPPGVLEHALQLFIVHDPQGSLLSIPPIEPLTDEERRPEAAVAGAEEDPEARLDYLREDLLANEHHRHWHLVYPGRGVPGPGGERVLQDRQGELFFYMHQQMLARYDADRLALGLERVSAYADYRLPILEGYGERPSATALVDIDRVDDGFRTEISVSELEAQRDAVGTAVAGGRFTREKLTASLNALGAAEEPQLGGELGVWHHGAGHVIAAWVMHPNGGGEMGLIGDTASAIRDPFFWRWHRHIDDFGYQLQEQFDEHTFDDAPPVTLRGEDESGGPDLILCFEHQLPGGNAEDLAVLQTWAEQTFGGSNFDRPPDATQSTDELRTHMTDSPFDPNDATALPVHHLDHEPFAVVVRLRNQGQERRRVTIRLFIAPEAIADDRRGWIELDKFDSWLEPTAQGVLVRPMRRASVARKPVSRPPQFMQPPAQSRREQYCRCGWPYHLLLPRGNPNGMPFKLAAAVTDFAHDHITGDTDCGSLSFCGSLNKEFPDRREMGYPFNRPFRTRTIAETLVQQHNMAARSFTIKHEEDGDG